MPQLGYQRSLIGNHGPVRYGSGLGCSHGFHGLLQFADFLGLLRSDQLEAFRCPPDFEHHEYAGADDRDDFQELENVA